MTRSAPSAAAYDEDFFAWTQDQAAALRRVSGHPEIDVEHLADEVEDMGRRDLREVRSLLGLLLVHLLKMETAPDAASVAHWRSEARAFSRSALAAFSPGMRRLIELARIWDDALESVSADCTDFGLAPPRRRPCPFELDDLLAKTIDVDAALAKMSDDRSP